MGNHVSVNGHFPLQLGLRASFERLLQRAFEHALITLLYEEVEGVTFSPSPTQLAKPASNKQQQLE